MLQPCFSARPRCGGTHARSSCDLYRWGHSAWRGLRGWCQPRELSAVTPQCRVSRRTGAHALSCRAVPDWGCSSRASGARPTCWGSHARSACYRHRWVRIALSGPGGWCPPFKLGTVALHCPASHCTSARAVTCRGVLHWRCSGRASSAHPRCCGSYPRSACDRHRWGRIARSGPGGWRPPHELGTVAVFCLAPRRTGARALSCPAVPNWRCSSRTSSARPPLLWHSRDERA